MFGKFQRAFWDSREVLIIIIFINHRLITDLFKQRQIENSFNSLFPLLSFLLTSVSSSSLHYHILHSLQSYLSSSSTVPSILSFLSLSRHHFYLPFLLLFPFLLLTLSINPFFIPSQRIYLHSFNSLKPNLWQSLSLFSIHS